MLPISHSNKFSRTPFANDNFRNRTVSNLRSINARNNFVIPRHEVFAQCRNQASMRHQKNNWIRIPQRKHFLLPKCAYSRYDSVKCLVLYQSTANKAKRGYRKETGKVYLHSALSAELFVRDSLAFGNDQRLFLCDPLQATTMVLDNAVVYRSLQSIVVSRYFITGLQNNMLRVNIFLPGKFTCLALCNGLQKAWVNRILRRDSATILDCQSPFAFSTVSIRV